ncbi:thioredoxin domain-containing protein [Aeromonas hydrophila]|uniref:hypothetical protein n=1 Tax=Aeromonas hydrophila TaxID=644 RepID=UPI002B495BCC|nr:hypothetical protein [Aeromonas hydrophila]
MSAKSATTNNSKKDPQTHGQRCDHPQIGTSIPLLVRKLAGDEFEDDLFWKLAYSIRHKKAIRLRIAGACAAILAFGGSVYAVHSINAKLDMLLSLQGSAIASNVLVQQQPAKSRHQDVISNKAQMPTSDPIEVIRANISKTLGLEKSVVLVKAVPDFNLFAVQIGTKGFLTDSTGTVAIPTKVVLPLSGQKEYFSSSVNVDVIPDVSPSVVAGNSQHHTPPNNNVEPDDQRGLDPNILFKNLNGMTIDLPAKGVKKGEIMVFFDTKCPHCKKQFKDIVAYADKGYDIKFLNTPLKSGADEVFNTAFCSGAPFEALNEYMQSGVFSKPHLDFNVANVGCMRKSGEIVLDVIKLMPEMPGTPYFAIKDVGFGTRGFVNSYLAIN